MKKIYQTLKKLFWHYEQPIETKKEIKPEPTNSKIGIGFYFSDINDVDVDIVCSLPNVDNLSIQEIEKLSEYFSELLFLINKGILKNQIFDTLDKEKNRDTDNTNMVLFIDNIQAFYRLIGQQYSRIQKNNTKPMIRPILAFKPYQ